MSVGRTVALATASTLTVPRLMIRLPDQLPPALLIARVPPSWLPLESVLLLSIVRSAVPVSAPERVMLRAVAAGRPLESAILTKDGLATAMAPL